MEPQSPKLYITRSSQAKQKPRDQQAQVAPIEVLVKAMQDPWLDCLRLHIVEGGIPSSSQGCPEASRSWFQNTQLHQVGEAKFTNWGTGQVPEPLTRRPEPGEGSICFLS